MTVEEQVSLNPDKGVIFEGPFTDPRMVPLKLKNGSKKRVTYKMKSTRGERFKLLPPFGYIAPGSEALVKMTCIPFDAKKHIPIHDRITVLIATAPDSAPSKAFDVWKHGQPLEPKNPRRVPLPVTYKPGPDEAKPRPKAAKEPEPPKKEEKKKEEPKKQKKEEDTESDEEGTSEGSADDSGDSDDDSGESTEDTK